MHEQDFWGTRKSYIFNTKTETYQKVSDLKIARWYPTLVGLKDGNILAVSGLNGYGQSITGNSEEFSPATDRWTSSRSWRSPFPTYPALFLMPNGDLFFTGASAGYGPATAAWRTPGIWNPNTNAFTPVTGMRDSERDGDSRQHPAAARPEPALRDHRRRWRRPVALSTGRIDIVDLNEQAPTLEARRPPAGRHAVPRGGDHPQRRRRDLGRIEVLPWHARLRSDERTHVDAEHGMVTDLANPLVGRDYHSEGLLLPDGRILTLGGNPLFGNQAGHHARRCSASRSRSTARHTCSTAPVRV